MSIRGGNNDRDEEMNESVDEGREEKEEVSMEEMSSSADPSLNGPPVPKKARISTVPQQTRVTRRSTRTGTAETTPTHTVSVDNSTVKRGESSTSSDGDSRDANDSPVVRLSIRSSGVEASGEREEEMEEDGDVEDNEGEEEGDDEAEDDDDGGRPGEHHDLLEDANGRIKVGQEYQARIVTSARETVERDDVTEDRDQVLWCSPTYKIDEQKYNDYIEEAIGTWKMTHDRALFILYKNNHNFEAAIDAVRKRRIVMDEWSEEDRMVFRHSFLHYGKNFRRIRHALPHRPMTSIISFYYTTKKEQGYKDLYEMKHVQHSDSDNDDDEGETGACENCGDKESKLRHVSAGRLCRPCRVYYNITRRHRPTPFRNQLHTPPDPCGVTVKKEWAKCPADMAEVAAEFEQMVRELEKDVPEEERQKNSPNPSDVDLSVPLSASSSIVNKKKNTKTPSTMALSRNEDVKQEIFRIRSRCLRLHSTLKKQKEKYLKDGVDKYRYLCPRDTRQKDMGGDEETSRNKRRLGYQWSEKEKMTTFHCLARYGKDFSVISDVVGTKSADQIKAFYTENKDKMDTYLYQVEAEEEREAKQMNLEDEVGVAIECVQLD